MRKNLLLLSAMLLLVVGCTTKKDATVTEKATVITNGLKFCEGSVAYNNQLLISNFGTNEIGRAHV